jgi:hypothetical protein
MPKYKPPKTDWLKLEISLEIIGNMIAHHVSLLDQAIREQQKNTALIKSIEDRIDELGKERQLCYVERRNYQVIEKAYTRYARFLKSN